MNRLRYWIPSILFIAFATFIALVILARYICNRSVPR